MGLRQVIAMKSEQEFFVFGATAGEAIFLRLLLGNYFVYGVCCGAYVPFGVLQREFYESQVALLFGDMSAESDLRVGGEHGAAV